MKPTSTLRASVNVLSDLCRALKEIAGDIRCANAAENSKAI